VKEMFGKCRVIFGRGGKEIVQGRIPHIGDQVFYRLLYTYKIWWLVSRDDIPQLQALISLLLIGDLDLYGVVSNCASKTVQDSFQ
jgi:hypothetical protein